MKFLNEFRLLLFGLPRLVLHQSAVAGMRLHPRL